MWPYQHIFVSSDYKFHVMTEYYLTVLGGATAGRGGAARGGATAKVNTDI